MFRGGIIFRKCKTIPSRLLFAGILLVPSLLFAQDKQEKQKQTLKIGFSGQLGAGAGHVLVVPVVYAAPGLGGRGKYRLQFAERWHLEGRGGLSLGIDESGIIGGGYGAELALGYAWIDVDWMVLSSDFHLGLSSYSLIPIPAGGFYHEAAFYPVDLDFFVWDIKLGLTTDLLLIFPNLGISAASGLTFFIGPLLLGIDLSAQADATVTILANSASAGLKAEVFAGFRF